MITALPSLRSLLWLCLLLASAGFANPASRSLENTIEALKSQRQQAQKLEKELETINEELETLRGRSQQLVQQVRTTQDRIRSNRAEIQQLEADRARQKTQLDRKEAEISALLHGIIRLQRMPRYYVMARPGQAETLLQTASALDVTYDATRIAMLELEQRFDKLEQTSAQLQQAQSLLQTELDTLQDQQAALQRTVRKRRNMQLSLLNDHREVKQRVAILSKESSNLKNLITRLDEEQALFEKAGLPIPKPSDSSRKDGFTAQKGQLSLPASGQIAHRFGDPRGTHDRYRGLELLTAANAPVTTPFRGTVMYSGDFLDYGPMVIIQHDADHHSVIAGLDVVEVEPGQPVEAGDVVGVMGKDETQRKLYFELRKNSKPIDPTAWIGNVEIIASR